MTKATVQNSRLIVFAFLIFSASLLQFLLAFHSSRTIDSDRHDLVASQRLLPVGQEELPALAKTRASASISNAAASNVKDVIFTCFNRSLPCFEPTIVNNKLHWTHRRNLKQPAQRGLFFLKLLKTGSTTGSSIHVRIATNLAKRLNRTNEVCRTRHLHGWAGPRMYHFGDRIKGESFLWTLLRDPTKRYISEFFHFEVSRGGKSPSDENAIHFLRHGKHNDRHYLSWLSTKRYRYQKGKSQIGQAYDTASNILRDYDFIGVLERFDESIVALKMLLDIPMSDVLYISSKTSGGYDDGEFEGRCVKIQPSAVSPGVKDFLNSQEWREYIAPEQELYDATIRSLDRTIDYLGRAKFETELGQFKVAQQMVAKKCESVVKLPCSLSGERRLPEETDCLTADIGCGFKCLDDVATQLNLW